MNDCSLELATRENFSSKRRQSDIWTDRKIGEEKRSRRNQSKLSNIEIRGIEGRIEVERKNLEVGPFQDYQDRSGDRRLFRLEP